MSFSFVSVADVIYPGSNRDHTRQAILNNVGYVVSHQGFTGVTQDVYAHNIDSTFTLTGFPSETLVELFFYKMSLHYDTNCSDNLNISGVRLADIDKEWPGPLFLCGTDSNEAVYYVKTEGSTIRFRFQTGAQGSKSGFLVQYRVIPEIPDYGGSTGDYTTTFEDVPFTTSKTGRSGSGLLCSTYPYPKR